MAHEEQVPPPVASADRSLLVQFDLAPPRLRWGATWSVVCGVVAAGPTALGPDPIWRALLAWWVVVPLLGAVWAPWLGPDRAPPLARDWLGAIRGWRRRAEEAEPLPPETLDTVLGLALALILAVPLGPAPVLIIAAVGGLVFVRCLLLGQSPAEVGVARSLLEIVVPGIVAWLALAGGQGLPAPEAVRLGLTGAGAAWVSHNWLVPALFAAFAISYYAASTVHRRGDLPRRRLELAAGYLAAIACLVVADHVWGALAIALLFVVQWPFEAMFRSGYVRWHFGSTEPLAMATMLAACLAAGWS